MNNVEQQQTFPAYEHHICLVSEQTLPNILPVLQHSAQRTKHLHLLTTPSMQAKADTLRGIIKLWGCKIWQYDMPHSQPEAIHQALEAAFACFVKQQGTSIAVNITGGTKVMAILAVQWANAKAIPFFYVDTTQENILSLQGVPMEYTLKDVLDVQTILAAQGYSVLAKNTNPIPRENQEFLENFLQIALRGGMPILNACASTAIANGHLSAPLYEAPQYAFLALLELCKQYSILDFTQREIVFASEDDARFCNGFWLEDYVRAKLYALHAHKNITSWACGVEVLSGTVKNEFDAVFTARNRLFVLECKTSQMTPKSGGYKGISERAGDNYIFKLEALGDKIGGIMVHKMLISLRPLSFAQEKRARSYNVQLVMDKDIVKLTEKLQHWIQTC